MNLAKPRKGTAMETVTVGRSEGREVLFWNDPWDFTARARIKGYSYRVCGNIAA